MSRTPASYGRRGRLRAANTGIRHTASTYGKAKFGTYSEKADGHLIVESDAERFVTHLLAIDPRVRAFQPQPFCVDLVDQRLLFTREAVREAWHKHRDVSGPKFYTVDFSIDWQDGLHHAIEVKTEGFEGDDVYWDKVARARPVLAANSYPLRTVVVPANTAHPIRMNSRVLKQATHHVRSHLNAELIERVTRRCEDHPVSLRMLCSDLALSPATVPVLLVGGVLAADLVRHPICGALELSLAYGDLDHLCLLEGVER
ncbi:hypothetical protein [Burkholderia thailandensis]|uniref:hypothetical protein n=1 Tax=Burkholderia thailandensis TaxID=57975 RepID=UPI0022AC0921|nr:hypothetical protein [Burkholderia thailandensis]MCZ2900946.1 hypothetical protein [Burkholderia thailandensis]MDD1480974.1 hypothetical protein [Burkholderia thailandensis]MDD1489133.1 hypothetical protein [Burkholderia thailandensis]MDD1493913.1 hypothetical protein [Burkholderia thailandensis]